MSGEQVDRNYTSRKFFVALDAISNGETCLKAAVQIPDDYGRTVTIDHALAAASDLEISVPDDSLGIVQNACRRLGIEPPGNKINEIACAIFDRLGKIKSGSLP